MASLPSFRALAIAFAVLLATTTNLAGAARVVGGFTATTKLQNDGGGESECWTSLANIRSCSNEIIGFLLNGQADIDKPCCLAIATIAAHCWPAMVGALGYSPEAVSFLQSYCEKSSASSVDLASTGSPN